MSEVKDFLDNSGQYNKFPRLDPEVINAGFDTVDHQDQLEGIKKALAEAHPGYEHEVACDPEDLGVSDNPDPRSEEQVNGHLHPHPHSHVDPIENHPKGVYHLSIEPIFDAFKNVVKSVLIDREYGSTSSPDKFVGHEEVSSLPLKKHVDYHPHMNSNISTNNDEKLRNTPIEKEEIPNAA